MLKVSPCFNFHGNCEQAITLYKKAFNGELQFILRYEDANSQDWNKPLSQAEKKLIYHAEMLIAGQRIMFSDILEFDLNSGHSLFLTISFPDAASVKKAYEIMKEGSTSLIPMKSTTYSSCMVSFIDKFGFRWALMTEQTAN